MATKLEEAQIPFITSVGPITIGELAALMLRLGKVDYLFDVEGSASRVKDQAGGLAWEGPLLKNLRTLAAVSGLELVIDGKFVRLIKGKQE